MAKVSPSNGNAESDAAEFVGDRSGWYLIFISIIFGVLISVWIVPTSEMLLGDEQGPSRYLDQFSQAELNSMLGRLGGLDLVRGALMFFILVSLWWWYGFFLGYIHPAHGYLMYLFDFCSLCSFALAFRVWSDIYLFPLAVFLASTLMLGRFWLARNHTNVDTRARHAINVALIVLFGFFGAAMVAIGTVTFFSAMTEDIPEKFREIAWKGIHALVVFLLITAVGVTFYAVNTTEGLKWGKPAKRKDWHAQRQPKPDLSPNE